MAEKNPSKVKVAKAKKPPKTFSFTLSLPGLISGVGAGVLALTFFFIMGILIGRGYRPEADVPQLDRIMPQKEHGQVAETQAPPEILKPEELEFPERLKESPEKVLAESEPETKPAPAPKPKPEPAKPKKAAETIKPEAFTPTQAKPGEKVYNYVYQVASFKKADMAEALSDKLVAAGLRTAIQAADTKGSTWHRVTVLHYGTPSSTAEMKAVLARFGIAKPLLKQKVAAQ